MQPVESSDPEGVDYGWVMQTTFVVTIVVGAPLVALLSMWADLATWGARAAFAVQVGAPVWFVTAIVVLLYAKRAADGVGGDSESSDDARPTEDSAEGAAAEDSRK